jgi:GNAT superfamily N-acetyltransferase
MVDPEWKGAGLGTALRDVIVDVARRRGVVALTADVLAENTAMLRVFRTSGLEVELHTSQGVSEIVLTL